VKQCTTHHHACDCREEKFKQLDQENAKLREKFMFAESEIILLREERDELREALVNADELERYSGSDDHRQWGKCSAWLHPDDAVVIISAKALDAARKEAQP
jgi:predicted nuclease with TOPRIM domain